MDNITNTVYVVHCVDTEGPLFESVEATFNRLKEIFGLDLEHSKENLKKLQKKEIDLGGLEDEVAKIVDPKHIDTNEDWKDIEKQVDKVTTQKFRSSHDDSFGGAWRYSWFVLDHVGFEGVNPRRRSLGHHAVYDQYKRWMRHKNMNMDEINWHYHPISIRSDAHRCATEYVGSGNIFEILARKIIDRKWFPSAFRPGFHAERPDSHWLLEQWIPFDFGNQSGKTADDQPDLARGRFGNWRRAPTSWIPYNPAYNDYQSRGNCRRYITRCLNMDTRHRNLTDEDVTQAFEEASNRGQSLLAFTDHDFRKMGRHVDKVWGMINETSKQFENVKFKNTTALKGIRCALNMEATKPSVLNAEIKEVKGKKVLAVDAKNDIFGPQPFLAIKTKSRKYNWQNFDRPKKDVWTYTFDFHTLPVKSIDRIGVAANSPEGITEILIIDPNTEELERQVLNFEE
jgi:hypothetical protein